MFVFKVHSRTQSLFHSELSLLLILPLFMVVTLFAALMRARNSTISELAFNSTSRELSFTVTGSSGTTGFVNIYIAKALVQNIADVKAYLDGIQLNYTTTSLDDSWLLHSTYLHSTHKVTISLGDTPLLFIETPLGKALIYVVPIATIIILISLYVLRKKRTILHTRARVEQVCFNKVAGFC